MLVYMRKERTVCNKHDIFHLCRFQTQMKYLACHFYCEREKCHLGQVRKEATPTEDK